jgi:hypothetical protein
MQDSADRIAAELDAVLNRLDDLTVVANPDKVVPLVITEDA